MEPTLSSSNKEDEESSSEKEEITPIPSSKNPHPSSHYSEESYSDESDSEESEDSDESHANIVTKSIDQSPKTTNPISKKMTKRPNENNEEQKDSKKAKTEVAKKQLFQRLWTDADEIALLDGIIEYSAKVGNDPMTDLNGFLDFIKDSIHFDVSKLQLSDKIRRLEKKYKNIMKRARKDRDPTFTKPNDQKSFELSKKIWGGSGSGNGNGSSKFNGKAARTNIKASQVIDGSVGVSVNEMVMFDKNLDKYVRECGLDLVDGSKRVEFELKWKKLQVAQLELFVERCKLNVEVFKLMLDAAKSSND